MSNLELLRAAVAAKLAYWDALGALETAIAPDGTFSDRANNRVIEQIDLLASGDCASDIDETHLADTLRLAGVPHA